MIARIVVLTAARLAGRDAVGSPLALRVTLLGMTALVARMSRRKYVITARMNERDYPHIVELALPPEGFRARSDDMLAFHRERHIQIHRGQGRNDDGQFYVRYCFCNSDHADAFCDRFGGERLTAIKRLEAALAEAEAESKKKR